MRSKIAVININRFLNSRVVRSWIHLNRWWMFFLCFRANTLEWKLRVHTLDIARAKISVQRDEVSYSSSEWGSTAIATEQRLSDCIDQNWIDTWIERNISDGLATLTRVSSQLINEIDLSVMETSVSLSPRRRSTLDPSGDTSFSSQSIFSLVIRSVCRAYFSFSLRQSRPSRLCWRSTNLARVYCSCSLVLDVPADENGGERSSRESANNFIWEEMRFDAKISLMNKNWIFF